MKKYTVQFYILKNVHWPMFESLYYYLKNKKEVEKIIFCIPDLPQLVFGNGHSLMDFLISTDETIVHNPRQFNVDVTFIADTVAGKVKGCGKIVNVGHGTISKGYYFTNSVWTERENWVDLLCVPGNYAKDQFDKILKTKVVATGMPKLDPVFSGKYNKETLCKKYDLDIDKKIVLYAPTFNIDLSSVYNFADRFHELHSENYYIICKFHGSTIPNIVEQYKLTCQKYPNLILADEPNLAPFLGGADIMISDVSSAFMEFMALDKAVILYNNPNKRQYHGYNSENIEYKWRDLGTEVSTFDELKQKLPTFITGDNKSKIRQSYAKELFADLKGEASVNVWNATKNILQQKSKVNIPLISVILKINKSNYFAIREKIHNIQFYSVLPIELILVVEEQSSIINKIVEDNKSFNQFYNLKIIDNSNNEDSFLIGKREASGKYIVFMQSNVIVFKNFDYMIYKTIMNNPDVEIFTGLSNSNDIVAEDYIPYIKGTDVPRYSYDFIWRYEGKVIEEKSFSIFPKLIVMKKKTYLQKNTFVSSVLSLLNHRIHVALSLYFNEISLQDFKTIQTLFINYKKIKIQDRLDMASKILAQYFYADLAELIWRDLVQHRGNTQDILKMMLNSCYTRYYDLDYKKEILRYLKKIPEIADIFSQEINFIEYLKHSTVNRDSKKNEIVLNAKHDRKKILFYFFKNVHISILLPIYEKMKQLHPNIEYAFSFLRPVPEMRAGLNETELNLLKKYNVPIYEIPQDFQPDITFIADSVYPWVQNCGKLVHVGHGILSKGQYYTDTEIARREEQADLICVPGSYHGNIMQKIISKPVIVTGMAKLDKIFSHEITRESVCEYYGLPADKKYILFAPTFNEELSAIPFLGKNINEVIPDQDTFLIIKLHGSTKKEYREMFKKMVQKDHRVILADEDETDLSPFLVLADIMISDVSSAMIEFIALNKPLILFNNPNWNEYKNFNKNDIEFQCREIAIETTSIQEIKRAIKIYSRSDKIKADERQMFANILLANKDRGDAAEKIVHETMSRF